MTRLIVVLSAALIGAALRANPAVPAGSPVESKRNTSIGLKTKITIQVKEMPVSQILTILTEAAQLKLVLMPAFPGHKEMTLDIKDLPLSTVFNQIAKRTHSHWVSEMEHEKLVVRFAPKKKS